MVGEVYLCGSSPRTQPIGYECVRGITVRRSPGFIDHLKLVHNPPGYLSVRKKHVDLGIGSYLCDDTDRWWIRRRLPHIVNLYQITGFHDAGLR